MKTRTHEKNRNKSTEETGAAGPSTANENNTSNNKFHRDLCYAMLSADIPLNKLGNIAFKNFLSTYIGRSIPDQTTLRKYYVSSLCNETITILRNKVAGRKIWVSLDETTDIEQRYIICFIFGVLGDEAEIDKSYLANITILQKVNHSTVATFFNDSLMKLWPEQILYENVLLAVTDAATYMCKAMTGLKVLYSNMIHVTCLAHGLHRVADLVRSNYTLANNFISLVKRIFVKSPSRLRQFHELAPDVPLPPSPVITRWGTWLEAVSYHSKYYDNISEVIMSFDSSEFTQIAECHVLLDDIELKTSLCCISSSFKCLRIALKQFEAKGLALSAAVNLIDNVQKSLNSLYDKSYSQKLFSVLQKNSGFTSLKDIESVLAGKNKVLPAPVAKYIDVISCFKHAPVVSCDAERFFSQYKTVLAENRRRFDFDNLKSHLIVKCNSLV